MISVVGCFLLRLMFIGFLSGYDSVLDTTWFVCVCLGMVGLMFVMLGCFWVV